jgi:hypothetical protein
MDQSALQGIVISLVQKGLIAAGTALATYFGLDQGNTTAALASLAPVLVGVLWGVWNKWQSHKVAVAASNAGVNVAAVKAAPVQAPKPA